MNPHQRRQLEDLLRSLPKAEQDRIYRRARDLRAEEQKRAKGERRRFADLDEARPGSARKKNDPLLLLALRVLDDERAEAASKGSDGVGADEGADQTRRSRSGLAAGDTDATRKGIAVQVGRRRCLVRPDRPAGADAQDAGDVSCHLPANIAARVQTDLCVGDSVEFRHTTDQRRERDELVRVLPRRTVLLRREPRTRSMRAVAANVDAVVIVVSVVSPPLHPRLIDRYLIAIENSWVDRTRVTETALADAPDPAQPIIAVNKTDLLRSLTPPERATELARLDPYRAMGVAVVECSAAEDHGLDALRRALAGKTVALVGHSGVGKSSLANALDPRLGARVGAIGAAANRGQHTTTSAQLYELAGVDGLPGFRVIDTPGIRSFGLDDLTEADLRDSFPELRSLRQGCRFNDCTHTHEPDCAVRDAAACGSIHPARYETYKRLLDELRRPEGYLPTQRIRVKPDEG